MLNPVDVAAERYYKSKEKQTALEKKLAAATAETDRLWREWRRALKDSGALDGRSQL